MTADVKDRVGWITMDRPPDNACDAAFLKELDRSVGEVAEAEAVVAVIRSASERFLSARGRRQGLPEAVAVDSIAQHRRAQQVLGRFADEAPLFIAAIAGHALGGGYDIALASDRPHRRRGPPPDRALRGHLRAAARHRRHQGLRRLIGRGRPWS